MKNKTAMQLHIDDLNKIKEMVINKSLDKDLQETITETINGCIENAESHLETEKNQIRKSFFDSRITPEKVTSTKYYNDNYL
jgi:predicted solute-binding protein